MKWMIVRILPPFHFGRIVALALDWGRLDIVQDHGYEVLIRILPKAFTTSISVRVGFWFEIRGVRC